MIVAMDGPAGSGKSTVASRVARELGLAHLDTGAMYRAITLVVLARSIEASDARACGEVARGVRFDFDEEDRILIDGVPGEPDIRSHAVTAAVSTVSAHPGVREAVVREQRAIASRRRGVVAEGRDTTTVVFPAADHKFFLNASPEERARRRAHQEGTPERAAEILAQMIERDRLDSTRSHSPLAKASDAVEIRTDGLTVDEVVERILAHVRHGEDE